MVNCRHDINIALGHVKIFSLIKFIDFFDAILELVDIHIFAHVLNDLVSGIPDIQDDPLESLYRIEQFRRKTN